MNRYELVELCFPGRTVRFAPKMVEERGLNGAVVGHLDIRIRRVQVGLTTITVAAIENLCVHPDRRREGIASRLLETAHLQAMEWPAVEWAATLDTVGLPGLLEPLGYRRPEGAPEGFVVADLADEPWPPGQVRLGDGWIS